MQVFIGQKPDLMLKNAIFRALGQRGTKIAGMPPVSALASWPTPPLSPLSPPLASALLPITEASHGVLIDMVYASAANFTGQRIYSQPLCLLHPEAEAALRRAIAGAQRMGGLRLKIFDAFRPQSAQEALWAVAPIPGFVADPARGSNHTRGVAVDLTLVDAQGDGLDMGTPMDTLTSASHHFNPVHSPAIQINRMRLLTVMLEAGFEHHAEEWWHYQLPQARQRFALVQGGFEGYLP